MNKKMFIILIVLLITLVGCNSNTEPAEVTTKNISDVTNKEAVRAYLSKKVTPISKEEFSSYKPFYIDINKDGKMDVAYSLKEWNGDLYFVLATETGFSFLNSVYTDIHKFTDISVTNNFTIVTGIHKKDNYEDKRTEIYCLRDGIVEQVASFVNESIEVISPHKWIGKGKITQIDSYNEIEYSFSLVEENSNTNKSVIIEQKNLSYSFIKDIQSYKMTEVGDNFTKDRFSSDLEATSDSNNNDSNNTTEISVKDIENGYVIDGFTVTDIECEGDTTSFTVKGDKWVKGTLVYYGDEYEGYYFTMEGKLLSKSLKFGSDLFNWYTTFDTVSGSYIANIDKLLEKLSISEINHLKDGNKLNVTAHIKDPKINFHYGSEGGTSITILDIKEVDNKDVNTNAENLTEFTNETIYDTYIDYSKYKCVIIPDSKSINHDNIEWDKLYFHEKQNTAVICTILGTLYDASITYYDYLEDKGVSYDYEQLKNIYLQINAPFNSDMAHVKIKGKVHLGNNEFEEVNITLDTIRSGSDYEIVTIK